MFRSSRTAAITLAACVAVVLAATGLAASAPVANASTVASTVATPAAAPLAKKVSYALPVRKVHPVPAGDEIIDGRGDSQGWHLYAAGAAGGWAWQPLATLAPARIDNNGQRWIGRQCLTGDGRYVIAVVAPWSADNSPAGADRGGIAYVVDAHSGAVRPLVSGVSLYYFTPSCGPGSMATLTSYAGQDERSTQLVLVDAARGAISAMTTLRGQYTDAVPASGDGFLAVSGRDVVAVSRKGRIAIRARATGQPFDLVANAVGGADYLVGAGRSASVWQLGAESARRVGDGDFSRLALYAGRAGHTVAVGTTRLNHAAGIVALPAQPAAARIEATSLDGTAYSPVPLRAASSGRWHAMSVLGGLPRTSLLLNSPGHAASWLPVSAAPAATVLPRALHDGSATTFRAATAAATCAVARNDVYLQAMQPSPHEVDWAANLAGRGLLTGSAARGSGFDNLGLPSYSPSLEFPLPAPFGPGGASIPREVLEAIFAQESNFNQASWHSVQGVAGNPLIADYYGAAGGEVPGVATPDCGYGLGQITTGMHSGESSYDLQRKVAVDYAENVAAAAQILAGKWNELVAAGITANDSATTKLENWYLAIWAYNSGLHANTGSGPWGLGWANNPANPDYPYNRGPFLHADTVTGYSITYGDAATPGNWPYQEKVFGWMEVPIESPINGDASYQGTIQDFDTNSSTNVIRSDAYELTAPASDTFCTISGDQCDPTVCSRAANGGNCDPATSDGTGPCTRSDFECWWHSPVAWCTALTPCHAGTWEYNSGDAEPPAPSGDYFPGPTCSVDTTAVPPGSDIVDSQPLAVNLQGCDHTNENWVNSGSFDFSYGDPAVPTSQQTDMDVHQLGTGLGGHMWFTHTNEPTDASGVSLWGVTGTWTPQVTKGRYQVKVFIPAAGATATQADYTVSNGRGFSRTVTIDQSAYTDQWVSLGYFWLGPGSAVSLTNLHVTSGGDLGFSGVAFIPAQAGTYVMLGDSYSAGEGSGTYDTGTVNFSTPQGTNNGHRSLYSYNRVFAASTTTFADPNSWVDVACSGALISPDFYSPNPNGHCPNEAGQITALNSDTSLVTLTFGGNDLGFAPIVQDCVAAGFNQWWNGTPLIDVTTCQQTDANKFATDLAAQSDPANAGGWPQLFDAIKAHAPNAEVVVLGYPHLFVGSTPQSTGRCLKDGWILDSDQDWLNSVADQIDAALQTAAKNAGFGYISTTAAFTGHELCTSAPWFTGILDPTPNDNPQGLKNYLQTATGTDIQQFFHPNVQGYAEEATMLAGSLQVP